MWDWLQNKHSIRKIYQISENLTYLFDPLLNRFRVCLTRVQCTKDIFPDNTSAIAHIYGCIMAEL